jgi:hypothetical protein
MKAVWGSKSCFFTSTETSILVKLADFAADDGSSIYPSVKRISAETRFSERCIKYTISSLIQKGILELVKSFNARKPNVYQINVSFLNKLNEENDFIDDHDTDCAEPNPESGANCDISRGASGALSSASGASRGASHTTYLERRAPHPSIEPSITIIEPSLSCENGGNFDDQEVQGEGSSKIDLESETQNDRSPDYSHPISVAIAPSVCLEKINFEESCGNELSNGLEADRIKASRGDYIHAQAPLEDPSETNTTKTCHFSASEALPLQRIYQR